MDKRTKAEIINAIAAGDTAALRELRERRKNLGWMDKYIGLKGTGSVPIEAWVVEMKKKRLTM